MARRTSTIVWTIVFVLVAALGFLAAVVGPRLAREIRAVAAPIAGLARSESAIAALNRELPFEPAPDGRVTEARLLVFLDVWEELRPRYDRWTELVDPKSHRRKESWEDAKASLAATGDVQRGQLEILRSHGMSPAELVWLDEVVVGSWWTRVAPLLSGPDRPAVAQLMRRTTTEDLKFVEEQEARHGRTPATQAVVDRLTRRLATAGSSECPELPEDSAENQELFCRYRKRISAIGDPNGYPLHGILHGQRHVSVKAHDSHLGGPDTSRED